MKAIHAANKKLSWCRKSKKKLLLVVFPLYYLAPYAVQWGGAERIVMVVPEYKANQIGRNILSKEKLIDFEYSTSCLKISPTMVILR